MLDPKQSVANVVLEHSECAAVFQSYRIDFCCRGEITIDAASREKGVDTNKLVNELTQAISARHPTATVDFRSLSTPDLVTYIVSKHHEYLRKALPFVRTLAVKVSRVHGEHNPKLRDLEKAVIELSDALVPHLDVEEQTLFPALQSKNPDQSLLTREFGNMFEEHLAVAKLLERIRTAAEDFVLPEWACNSYRTLFAELEQLEGDIFRHVHLENHVLMPKFTQLAAN